MDAAQDDASRYVEALRAWDGSAPSRAALVEARTMLIASLNRLFRKGDPAEDTEALLDGVYGALLDRLAGSDPPPPDLQAEFGAIDAITTFFRVDPVRTLAPEVREVAREAQQIRILRRLRDGGRTSNRRLGEIAHLNAASVTPASRETQMSGWVKRLCELGLVNTVRVGREQQAGISPAGRRLLDLIEGRALPDPDAPHRSMVAEAALSLVSDLAAHPAVSPGPKPDPAWFYAMVGALHYLDAKHRDDALSLDEQLFVIHLVRYPFLDLPDSADRAALERLDALGPGHGSRERAMINVLVRFQDAGARAGLSGALADIGGQLGAGDPDALLWASCATTVAWAAGPGAERTRLLRRVGELVGRRPEPLAHYTRALGAYVAGDTARSTTLWAGLAGVQLGARSLSPVGEVLHRASRQVVAAGKVNHALLRLTESLDAHVARRLAASGPRLDLREWTQWDQEAMQAFVAWVRGAGTALRGDFRSAAPALEAARYILQTREWRDRDFYLPKWIEAVLRAYWPVAEWIAAGAPEVDAAPAPDAAVDLAMEGVRLRYEGPGITAAITLAPSPLTAEA